MMTKEQIQQRDFYLAEFSRLARAHYEDGDMNNCNYWRGQVLGLCRAFKMVDPEFDSMYWLTNLI